MEAECSVKAVCPVRMEAECSVKAVCPVRMEAECSVKAVCPVRMEAVSGVKVEGRMGGGEHREGGMGRTVVAVVEIAIL
jgi:hypothetical protein